MVLLSLGISFSLGCRLSIVDLSFDFLVSLVPHLSASSSVGAMGAKAPSKDKDYTTWIAQVPYLHFVPRDGDKREPRINVTWRSAQPGGVLQTTIRTALMGVLVIFSASKGVLVLF